MNVNTVVDIYIYCTVHTQSTCTDVYFSRGRFFGINI